MVFFHSYVYIYISICIYKYITYIYIYIELPGGRANIIFFPVCDRKVPGKVGKKTLKMGSNRP
jgi:hypothetical protein